MTAIKHRCDQQGGGWTLDTLQEHNQIVDALKDRLMEERDRRYSEVKAAEEKALIIKQRADEAALGLAREIQTYKDEKANQLREQIGAERGTYATKDDLASSMRELAATTFGLKTQSQESLRGLTGIAVAIIATIALAVSLLPYLHR